MQIYDVLAEEYARYYKREITKKEAYDVSRLLPETFTELIIENNIDEFRVRFRNFLPFIEMDKNTLLKKNREIIATIIRKRMLEQGMTYRELYKQTGISEATLFYFIAKFESISMIHVQTLMHHFGLALDVVSFELLSEKYLTVVEDDTPPTDEDLNGPVPPVEKPVEKPTEPTPPVTEPETPVTPPIEPVEKPTEPTPPVTEPETPIEDDQDKEPVVDEPITEPSVPVEENKELPDQEDNEGDIANGETKTEQTQTPKEPQPEQTEVDEPENKDGEETKTSSGETDAPNAETPAESTEEQTPTENGSDGSTETP